MKGRLLEQHLSRQTVNFVCLTWRSRYQYSAGILGNGTRYSYARRNHQLGEGNGCTFSIGADVQVRNERAVHLYRKMGFQIEAVMPRGARTDLGEFLDVYKMSYLIE